MVSDQHVKASFREAGEWAIFDKPYWPGETFGDQLGFALRHENLDLLVLKRIFDAIPQDTVAAFVRSSPTGALTRRAWFLYELLIGRTLDIEDVATTGFTDLLDSLLYFTAAPVPSRRHKVRDNLLGNRNFCRIIRKTQALTDFGAHALGAKANEIIGHTGANVLARAASFLLLADSRAASRSKAKSRRATALSVGGGPCHRPERTS